LYKTNWDAAVDIKNARIGVGISARDSQELVFAARSRTLSAHVDPLVAEAWAASHAILFSKEVGIMDIVMERDALQVVNEINEDFPFLSRIGHFTKGIKLVFKSLHSCNVIYVKREANFTTHVLDKIAVFNVQDSIWLEETPPQVLDIIFRESVCL